MTRIVTNREFLESQTLSALTAIYNAHATKQIKKFTCSKTEAVERVLSVLPVVHVKQGFSGPRTGVCARMTQWFSEGLSSKDVFAKVQQEIPEAKTSLKAVYWYKAYLKGLGCTV